MTETQRRWAIGFTALLVVLLGLLAEWLAHGTRLGFAAQRDLIVGWAIAAAGLIAWAWVPRSRIGPLLVVVGLTWFIGTVADPITELGRVGRALTFLYAGVLAHALVTWPTGRASDALDRILVTGGYLVALFPPLWDGDSTLLVLAGLLAAALLVRHITLPPRSRRIRRPVTALGLGLAVTLAAKGPGAAMLRESGVAYPGDALAIWEIALVVMAVGIAWALIALERRRRLMTDLVVRLGDEDPSRAGVELPGDAGLADDPFIAEALRKAEEMSRRNAALRHELSAQAEALETSRRRLLLAGDEERAALEDRLRRGATARLTRLAVDLEGAPALRGTGAAEADERIARARAQLAAALLELDELARGLDPGLIGEHHLPGALLDLAERSPVPVDVSLEAIGVQEPSTERALYYVASEALANIAKHAQAARAWLRLSQHEGSVTMVVEDDGVGGADPGRGSGLTGLRDRLDALGGTLEVRTRRGGGTLLRATVPPAARVEG